MEDLYERSDTQPCGRAERASRLCDSAGIAVAQLESTDLVHGFQELYGLIERYIKKELADNSAGSRYVRWLKSGSKFIGLEALKVGLKKALEGLL